ncbi:hypothetical protein N656DRAFT_778107, partial [Canariomyces notabilis]
MRACQCGFMLGNFSITLLLPQDNTISTATEGNSRTMAEILGTAASVLSIAAFFNNCVDCFEYIQLGRHFGRDYQVCQLRLDIAKTRLARWGQAVRVNEDVRFSGTSGGGDDDDDRQVQLARSILEEIVLLLESAAKTSRRYELRADKKDLVRFDEKQDLHGAHRRLHDRLRALTRKRQNRGRVDGRGSGVGLARKAAWALYDGKQFEKLVEQVLGLVDELEKTFPVAGGECRKLAEIDVVELGGGGDGDDDEQECLEVLKEAASNTDEVLVEAVVQRLEMTAAAGRGNRNYVKEVTAGEQADVQVGQQYSEAVLLANASILMPEGTTNAVDVVVAKGLARVHVGSRFGVRF